MQRQMHGGAAEAAYGPTAPKLQGCNPLRINLRRYLPKSVARPRRTRWRHAPRGRRAAQKKWRRAMAQRRRWTGRRHALAKGSTGIAPWPARLQALLPNLNVEVRATRSTSSAWALGNLACCCPCADVLFVDAASTTRRDIQCLRAGAPAGPSRP